MMGTVATLMMTNGAFGDTGVLCCFIVLGNSGFKRQKKKKSCFWSSCPCSEQHLYIAFTYITHWHHLYIYSPASVLVQLTAACLALLFAQLDV